MKLVKCGNCGQSINQKRDVCPFCGAAIVKAPLLVPPPPKARAVDAVPDIASAATSASTSVWWKRPNIIIPAVVGAVFVVLLLGRVSSASTVAGRVMHLPLSHGASAAVSWTVLGWQPPAPHEAAGGVSSGLGRLGDLGSQDFDRPEAHDSPSLS